MEASSNDEIDLVGLAVAAIRYFKKHLTFILVFTGTGMTVAFAVHMFTPRVYESKMIFESDILNESYVKQFTETINNLIDEKNFKDLSSQLSLPEAGVKMVALIKIEKVKKDPAVQKDGTFIVTANITNREVLTKLQSGILQMLRNNDFVKIQVRQRKEMYTTLIEKTENEIHSLDSLKKIFIKKGFSSKEAEAILVDPSQIMNLHKELATYKNKLEIVEGTQLVEGFTFFKKTVGLRLSLMLSIGFFGGLFVAIGLLTFSYLLKLANSPN